MYQILLLLVAQLLLLLAGANAQETSYPFDDYYRDTEGEKRIRPPLLPQLGCSPIPTPPTSRLYKLILGLAIFLILGFCIVCVPIRDRIYQLALVSSHLLRAIWLAFCDGLSEIWHSVAIQELKAKYSTVQQQLDKAHEWIEALEGKNQHVTQQLETVTSDRDNLKKFNSDLKKSNEDLEKTNHDHGRQIEILNSAEHEATQARDIAEFRTAVHHYESQTRFLSKQAKEDLDKFNNLKANSDTRIIELQHQVAALKIDISQGKKAAERMELTHTRSITMLERDNAGLTRELYSTRRDFQAIIVALHKLVILGGPTRAFAMAFFNLINELGLNADKLMIDTCKFQLMAEHVRLGASSPFSATNVLGKAYISVFDSIGITEEKIFQILEGPISTFLMAAFPMLAGFLNGQYVASADTSVPAQQPGVTTKDVSQGDNPQPPFSGKDVNNNQQQQSLSKGLEQPIIPQNGQYQPPSSAQNHTNNGTKPENNANTSRTVQPPFNGNQASSSTSAQAPQPHRDPSTPPAPKSTNLFINAFQKLASAPPPPLPSQFGGTANIASDTPTSPPSPSPASRTTTTTPAGPAPGEQGYAGSGGSFQGGTKGFFQLGKRPGTFGVGGGGGESAAAAAGKRKADGPALAGGEGGQMGSRFTRSSLNGSAGGDLLNGGGASAFASASGRGGVFAGFRQSQYVIRDEEDC
ncbi:hypothetical protein EJ04DRAFT_552502 [Polyplosphaeria fusca]|uniref:Uncharacterized protein n=1 Tax=Polyplosphaeria fusca TaxID=682080 RepID=A0A9P4QYF0_9PLEO|nr:hypothetical protein EJ04DRAFT_552502 [Polyplosphaeria fusca]